MGSNWREADKSLWCLCCGLDDQVPHGLTKAQSRFGRAFKNLDSAERLKAKASLGPCLFLISILPKKQSHIVTANPAQGKPWRGLATVSLYFLEAWSSLWCWPKVHTTLHWFLSWLENTTFTLLCSLRLCILLLQRPTHPGYPRVAPEVKLHVSSSSGGGHTNTSCTFQMEEPGAKSILSLARPSP